MLSFDVRVECRFIFGAVITIGANEFRNRTTLVFHMIIQMFLVYITFIAIRTLEFFQVLHCVFISIMTFESPTIAKTFRTNPAIPKKYIIIGFMSLEWERIGRRGWSLLPNFIVDHGVHSLTRSIWEQILVK